MLYVGVVGPGSEAGEALLLEARRVGHGLATAGAIVLCGGLGGVMEAVCAGVAEGGGQSVGLLPGDRRGDGNRFLAIALPTGLGQARNAVLVTASDVVIAIGRGYGTLSEISLALRAGKPVVGLDTWEIAQAGGAITRARDADEAVVLACELGQPTT